MTLLSCEVISSQNKWLITIMKISIITSSLNKMIEDMKDTYNQKRK
jgi:hypothetical protein